MKLVRVLLGILLGGGTLIPAFGETGVIAQGNILQKDFAFYWQCRLEPGTPPMANSLGYASGINNKTGNIYRVMIDRPNRTYFGYEVRVESLAQRNTYRMTFHPLDLNAETLQRTMHIDDPATWNKREIGAAARPLSPSQDAPDTVHTLDVIEVDLLVNPATGQRITDYVVLQDPDRGAWTFDLPIHREFVYAPGSARDFSAEDANLRIDAPRLRVNRIDAPNSGDELSGPVIWVYVQNHGRYLLSLLPRPGFRKAGEVRGTALTFAWGADKFTIGSASRIAPGDAPFNLYVMDEPEWKPASPNASAAVLFGTLDRR